MDILKQIFGERIIWRNSAINRSARSPDLTASDYFLWGYLKKRVYINKPRTIQQLKENIQAEILALQPETLVVVMKNILKRARFCEAANRGHLQDIVFHT